MSDPDTKHESGVKLSPLAVGSYTVCFSDVEKYTTPTDTTKANKPQANRMRLNAEGVDWENTEVKQLVQVAQDLLSGTPKQTKTLQTLLQKVSTQEPLTKAEKDMLTYLSKYTDMYDNYKNINDSDYLDINDN